MLFPAVTLFTWQELVAAVSHQCSEMPP